MGENDINLLARENKTSLDSEESMHLIL